RGGNGKPSASPYLRRSAVALFDRSGGTDQGRPPLSRPPGGGGTQRGREPGAAGPTRPHGDRAARGPPGSPRPPAGRRVRAGAGGRYGRGRPHGRVLLRAGGAAPPGPGDLRPGRLRVCPLPVE